MVELLNLSVSYFIFVEASHLCTRLLRRLSEITKGYVRSFRVLNKRRVTRNEKMRIFDKMDEVVERKGDIARLNYILRKEKPDGKLRREYQKDLKAAKAS